MNIVNNISIIDLEASDVEKLQRLLSLNGFDLEITSEMDDPTLDAFVAFKENNGFDSDEFIDKAVVAKMKEKVPRKTPKKAKAAKTEELKDPIAFVVEKCKKKGLTLKQQIAYVLATVDFEGLLGSTNQCIGVIDAMIDGDATGIKLENYINDGGTTFLNARRSVTYDMENAEEVTRLARNYNQKLISGEITF